MYCICLVCLKLYYYSKIVHEMFVRYSRTWNLFFIETSLRLYYIIIFTAHHRDCNAFYSVDISVVVAFKFFQYQLPIIIRRPY